MMKKRFLCCLCLAIFTAVSLFGFTACGNNQDVLNRLDALESNIDALEAKVEALEAANANFQQQLAALDTSSDTFADDLAELTSNYNTLAASVQNATHIERVIVAKEKLNEQSIVKNVYLTLTCADNKVAVIGCSIEYLNYPPVFHRVTCVTEITIDQQQFTANISLTRADVNTNTNYISGSQVTDIAMTNESTASKDWTEIIFYTFY